MKNLTVWQRLMYVSAGLVFLVLLIGAILSSFRRGKAIKGLLIVSGIFLILLGLLISDGGFAYIDSPSSRPTAIYIFICVGFDLIAGILAFVAIYKRRKLISVK